MAEIVNLRMARKAKARVAKEAEAAEKRALHGRSKAARELAEAEKVRAERELEGKKLKILPCKGRWQAEGLTEGCYPLR